MSKAFPVKGLQQLDNYLSALPKRIETGAYRAALTAAAAVIRDEARVRAPKQTGKLARSIASGSPRKNPDGTFSISIGPRGKEHAFLGTFHEYGVRPHYITSGTSALKPRKLNQATRTSGHSDVKTRALVINGQFVTGAVLHPGHGAQPFLRPALDAKAEEATRAFAARIQSYIEGKTGFTAPITEGPSQPSEAA